MSTLDLAGSARRLGGAAAALAGLTFGIVALTIRLRPQVAPPALVNSWPLEAGIPATVAFVMLLVTAHLAYRRIRPVAWLVPLLVALTGLSVAYELPERILGTDTPGAVDITVVRLVLGVGVAVAVVKVLLLHRYAGRGIPPLADGVATLLPFQQTNLTALKRLVAGGPASCGRVVPVRGRQGEGKSFLLRQLQDSWTAERGAPAVAIVDVWQAQTEVDLHVSIVESLLTRPQSLRRLRWLTRVPTTFALARALAHLQNTATAINIKLLGGSAPSVETRLALPKLAWQRTFERVASGSLTVVVLDEIERATPEVAQAAVTIAKRALDMPGVTVVLPYIPTVARHKVFNPAVPALPDLASSMDAVLFEWVARTEPLRLPSGWHGWSTKEDDSAATRPERRGGPAGLRSELVEAFLAADPDSRTYLQTTFEEKYLGFTGIRLAGLRSEDLVALVIDFAVLRGYVQTLIGDEPPVAHEAIAEPLLNAIRRGLARSSDAIGGPPLRSLLGELHALLLAAVRTREAGSTHTIETVAVLLLVALDHTTGKYRTWAEEQP